MTFEIEIDGEPRTVTVDDAGPGEPAGGRFRIRVADGPEQVVDCQATDLGLVILYPETGRIVDAAVTERSGGEWLVQLPQVSLTAAVDGRRFGRLAAGHGAAAGEQRLIAPMPGRVVRVLVTAGDEVAARQGLVVVEAMKMENELTAVRAGRVKEVAVVEGVSVEAGRLLVVVE
jgi:biotin carboxyl carrier protein